MLKSLTRFFKRAPIRNPNDDPVRAIRRGSRANETPVISYAQKVMANDAMLHPFVFRCLHKIAASAQTVSWYATQDTSLPANQRASAGDIKRLNELLNSVNDTYDPAMLRYWMALTFACFGRVPFKIGVSPINQMPNGVYPLRADYVKRVYNSFGRAQALKYGTENPEVIPLRGRQALGEAYAYEIFTPNLSANTDEQDYCFSPLYSIGLPAAIIQKLMERAFDTATGHPNSKYIVAADKTLTTKQIGEMEEFLEESAAGGSESGNVLALHNVGKLDVHKLDNDLSDIHSKMPLDDMARMIAGAYGIPVSLVGLGAADGAKFANNYEASRLSFWEDTMIPVYLNPIETGMTGALCPPGAVIRFDHDTIPALSMARATKAKELKDVDFLTKEEKRELIGYGPKPDEGMGTLEPTGQTNAN